MDFCFTGIHICWKLEKDLKKKRKRKKELTTTCCSIQTCVHTACIEMIAQSLFFPSQLGQRYLICFLFCFFNVYWTDNSADCFYTYELAQGKLCMICFVRGLCKIYTVVTGLNNSKLCVSTAVISTVTSRQEASGFDDQPGWGGWCGVNMFSLCLWGFPSGALPSHSPKTCL